MNGNVLVSYEPKRTDRGSGYAKERHAGALAASAWLHARGLYPLDRGAWDVAIALDVVDAPASPTVVSAVDSRFHIAISPTEWGFLFCHRGLVSWIRVTDMPFVNERDEYGLLAMTPPLRDLGALVRGLEKRFDLVFRRDHASIRSSLLDADEAVRRWLVTAL